MDFESEILCFFFSSIVFFFSRFAYVRCVDLLSPESVQHVEGTTSYMSDVPFTPIWNQDPAPPIVSYPELMGFPCSDLALWPRSQIGGIVSHQRLSPRGAMTASNGSASTKKTRRRVASVAQRRAANIRERRRMFNLNEAFDKLRRKVYWLVCVCGMNRRKKNGKKILLKKFINGTIYSLLSCLRSSNSELLNVCCILNVSTGAHICLRKTFVTHRNITPCHHIHWIYVGNFGRNTVERGT